VSEPNVVRADTDDKLVHRPGTRVYPWPLCHVRKLAIPGRYATTLESVTCTRCLRLP
jgi:hypothetical protein